MLEKKLNYDIKRTVQKILIDYTAHQLFDIARQRKVEYYDLQRLTDKINNYLMLYSDYDVSDEMAAPIHTLKEFCDVCIK